MLEENANRGNMYTHEQCVPYRIDWVVKYSSLQCWKIGQNLSSFGNHYNFPSVQTPISVGIRGRLDKPLFVILSTSQYNAYGKHDGTYRWPVTEVVTKRSNVNFWTSTYAYVLNKIRLTWHYHIIQT